MSASGVTDPGSRNRPSPGRFGSKEVAARFRRALGIAWWNALVLASVLVVLFAVFETYMRLTLSFVGPQKEIEFRPGVGMVLKPGSEVRATNGVNFWTVSRVNSLGFLDRQPPTPERVAASCHVAVVGDSFVQAEQVPIADKLHLRLEALAREQFPQWDVTTAAYGFEGTGQVEQLPWWDEWIRHTRPKLVVVVLVQNDFKNNLDTRKGLWSGVHARARRASDGSLVLVGPSSSPPHPGRFLVQEHYATHVGHWLERHAANARYWLDRVLVDALFARADPASSPPPRDELALASDLVEFTTFALDQWQQRTRSAGASLVVLAAHSVHSHDDTRAMLGLLKEKASARGIPVVEQMNYITRQGGDPRDAVFKLDGHWSPQGHQWAAEALLEWMAANPSVCER